MARFLWLNWCGGGNLPPSLGIARALSERGHSVAFAGRPEMVSRVAAAGFRAIELTAAYEQLEKYPQGSPLRRAACYLTSPASAAQLRGVVASEAPDIVLIDGMFPAALSEAAGFGRPTAVICHTFLFRALEIWRQQIARLNGMRVQAGFSALPGLDELWPAQTRVVVTTLAEFDTPRAAGWEMVRHVGPVLEDETRAVPASLPWGDDDVTPLVLVSFSTGFEQRSADKLQRSLAALAGLPVHVVATTGAIVEAGELSAPANAIVLDFAAHDPIIRRAALVVTHGGHGTAMRALAHGVPMIFMPGLAHDQPVVAGAVAEWGAGQALAGDADAFTIRAAAREILFTPSYRSNARRRAASLAGINAASNAANELEGLVR